MVESLFLIFFRFTIITFTFWIRSFDDVVSISIKVVPLHVSILRIKNVMATPCFIALHDTLKPQRC